MLSTAIVIFREILEIALILSVVAAATKGMIGRNRLILSGLGLGFMGSLTVAVFAQKIADAAEGMGQELFNAAILLTASAVIGWTVLWMAKHAKEFSAHIKNIGKGVMEGSLPTYSLIAVIALAMLREGTEIVLFTHGMIASGQAISSILIGSTLGLVSGSLVGAALYLGLISFSPKYIFKVTSWLLIFLCAGMSATAAKFLVSAGWFPGLSDQVWDSSALLSDSGILGETLGALFGYTARPAELQIVFYVITLGILVALMQIVNRKKTNLSNAVA